MAAGRTFRTLPPCSHLFSGSAGGYIPTADDKNIPAIGSRVSISKAINQSGEVVSIDGNNTIHAGSDVASFMHLQVPSIFIETYKWLENERNRGSSVDVETFYILRAIQSYNKKKPSCPVIADCGYFVSDVVGEKPLRNYSNVYQHYSDVLSEFLRKSLVLIAEKRLAISR